MTTPTNLPYCHLPRAIPTKEPKVWAAHRLRIATHAFRRDVDAMQMAPEDREKTLGYLMSVLRGVDALSPETVIDPACSIEGGVVAPAVLLTRRAHLREGRL